MIYYYALTKVTTRKWFLKTAKTINRTKKILALSAFALYLEEAKNPRSRSENLDTGSLQSQTLQCITSCINRGGGGATYTFKHLYNNNNNNTEKIKSQEMFQ